MWTRRSRKSRGNSKAVTLRRATQDELYNTPLTGDDPRPARDRPEGDNYHDATHLAVVQTRLEGVGWAFHRESGNLVGFREGEADTGLRRVPMTVRVGALSLDEWTEDPGGAQTPDRLDSDAICLAAAIRYGPVFA